MSSDRNQHIVPHEGRWAVKPEGAKQPSSTHSTQREAIDRGRQVAEDRGGELLIHGRDGRIRERDSHGRDPFPPKG
jgi:hypothetical protein